jgi:putative peptidoglycan lipid II flippase
MALTLPAAVALVVIAEPIIQVLFQRGAFAAADTAATSSALVAFAAGLPAFVLIKVLQPGFFAREDTKTPMWFAAVSVIVNVAGSLALFPSLEHVGIAIATSVAGYVNAALLGIALWRRKALEIDKAGRRRVPLILFAALLMGVALYFGTDLVDVLLVHESGWVRVGGLTIIVTAGVALFVALVQVTGAVDFRRAFRRQRS